MLKIVFKIVSRHYWCSFDGTPKTRMSKPLRATIRLQFNNGKTKANKKTYVCAPANKNDTDLQIYVPRNTPSHQEFSKVLAENPKCT